MSMTAPAPRHVFEVFTLGFLVQDGRVLLLERRKPPNAGRWNAPGGKLEAGEDPIQGIVREFAEETGLTLEDPTLRAVLCFHELDGAWRPQMIYTFLARRATGSLLASEEGRLAWWPVEQVLHDPRVVGNIPLFLPRMLAAGPPFVFIAAYRGERLEGYRVAPLLAGSDDGRAGSSDGCAASGAGRPASGDGKPAPGPGAPPHA
ncbi:MAG TPA: 8-oxo-dGTP diphosphatase [Thermaerobacter sp.]